MTCKFNGLFSVGEDFDDEELLATDWTTPLASVPPNVAAAAAPCALRPSSAAHNGQNKITPQPNGERSTTLHSGAASKNTTQPPVGLPAASGLRQLSTSAQQSFTPPLSSPFTHPPIAENAHQSSVSLERPGVASGGDEKASVPQDDFDDWDLDLSELDETDPQMGTGARVQETIQTPSVPAVPAVPSVGASTKSLRPLTCGGTQDVSSCSLRGPSATNQVSGLPPGNLPGRSSPSVSAPRPAPPPPFRPATPQSSSPFPRPASDSRFSSPSLRATRPPLQQPQGSWDSPGPHPRNRSLFESISPAPTPSPALTPRSLHTPVLTNHLIQLVSASKQTPGKRPRLDHNRPRTRRFPGPAGLLPQQPHGQSLDDIVVSAPQTPAHGAVPRLPSQPPSSQGEEDEFIGGPWAAMKAEMGLDERNPTCFLHSYSVVMVLRKAALKQLVRNKVPNMAVMLKNIIHTHADAKAVFRDPTGEIQGTVHRRLLEDRQGDLKAGAVLLLKQVGVFSPSHRNHYLNVTPNNLLRIYPAGGLGLSAGLPSPQLEPVVLSPGQSLDVPGAPTSRMQLLFDEDEDGDQDGEGEEAGQGGAPTTAAPSRPVVSATTPPEQPAWDTDDDLDELMGELPEEAYNF